MQLSSLVFSQILPRKFFAHNLPLPWLSLSLHLQLHPPLITSAQNTAAPPKANHYISQSPQIPLSYKSDSPLPYSSKYPATTPHSPTSSLPQSLSPSTHGLYPFPCFRGRSRVFCIHRFSFHPLVMVPGGVVQLTRLVKKERMALYGEEDELPHNREDGWRGCRPGATCRLGIGIGQEGRRIRARSLERRWRSRGRRLMLRRESWLLLDPAVW